MAQTKHEIQAILAQINSQPRHRFGQNFMIDGNLLRIVADAGRIQTGDRVIEIGPGTGTLTEELLSRGAQVICVEIDRDLAAALRERMAGREDFTLIEGDALDGKHALNAELLIAVKAARAQGRPVKLVANLPYNIASPLVIEMLAAGVDLLAFTVQKEVADRMRAPADSEDYGPLSVMAQMLAEVEVLRTLPPSAFWPVPKNESAQVRMVRRDRLGGDAPSFGRFVRKVFSARRKTLRKALAMGGFDAEALLTAAGADGRQRPESLSPTALQAMFAASLQSPRREDNGYNAGAMERRRP
jgi:16S rRNA (adenine1518-N6/adenine1519-N6)-dimethyltransferase